MTTRYLIRDEVADAQRFPLTELVSSLILLSADKSAGRWRIRRSRGYGREVCRLEDQLEARETVEIGAHEILTLARDSDQWFYDLDCEMSGPTVRFGIFDSSYMFIEGDRDIIGPIAGEFSDVTEAKTHPLWRE